MNIRIKKLHPDAIVPRSHTEGAACFDLHALYEGFVNAETPWGERFGGNDFRTGLSFEIPAGHAMLVFSRSGHGFRNDMRLANCVGVIDADYRGEVMVRLTRDGAGKYHTSPVRINAGDRIAQAMIIPVPRVQFEVVDELTETVRGTGGFGSTGA